MITLYSEYKITDARQAGKDSKFLIFKSREKIFPGQFFLVYIKGVGEIKITPIQFEENTLSFFVRNGENEKENLLFQTKPKDSIFIRGPYGRGFPMNNFISKEITLISNQDFIDNTFAILYYLKNNKESYKKINLITIGKESNGFSELISKEFQNLPNFIIVNLDDAKEIQNQTTLKKDTIILLNLPLLWIKTIFFVLEKTEALMKNTYFYFPRKISCGIGICGACACKGHHACIDGPVFKAEMIDRLL